MRYAVRYCSDPRAHRIHVVTEGEVGKLRVYVCPGDRFGEIVVRASDSLPDLVEAILPRAGTFVSPCPSHDGIVEHRAPSVTFRNGVRHSRCHACGIHLIDTD